MPLVYGNVEIDRSPNRVRGFQTLLRPAEIDPRELVEIEARLLFQSAPGHEVKRLFFVTSNRRAVIATLSASEATDQFGRSGLYLGQAIVVAAEEMQSCGWDVFGLFDVFPLANDLDGALALGDPAAGRSRALELTLPEGAGGDAGALPPEWLALARQADSLRSRRLQVCLTGSGADVEAALRRLFAAVPVAWRARCTFDTHFVIANPVQLPYWALGFAEGERLPSGAVLVEARTDAVRTPTPGITTGLFEDFVVRRRNQPAPGVPREWLEAVDSWSGWLDGGPPPAPGAAADDVFLELLDTQRSGVERRVREEVGHRFGPAVGFRIAARLEGELHADPRTLLGLVRRGVDANRVARWIWEVLPLDPRVPDAKERAEWAQLLPLAHHDLLELLFDAWSGKGASLPLRLERLTPAEREEFLARWVLTLPGSAVWGVRGVPGGVLLGVLLPVPDESRASLLEDLSALAEPPAGPMPFPVTRGGREGGWLGGLGRGERPFEFHTEARGRRGEAFFLLIRALAERMIRRGA